MKIRLDNKTILLDDSIDSILRTVNRVGRKGIDIRLYKVAGDETDTDVQTVATFLASRYNPNPVYQKDMGDIEKLLSESLDRIIISDRVRSTSDFYKTNARDSDRSNSLVVDFDGQSEN